MKPLKLWQAARLGPLTYYGKQPKEWSFDIHNSYRWGKPARALWTSPERTVNVCSCEPLGWVHCGEDSCASSRKTLPTWSFYLQRQEALRKHFKTTFRPYTKGHVDALKMPWRVQVDPQATLVRVDSLPSAVAFTQAFGAKRDVAWPKVAEVAVGVSYRPWRGEARTAAEWKAYETFQNWDVESVVFLGEVFTLAKP